VLANLEQFPLDVLKMNKSFMSGMHKDPGKANLVRGIVELSHRLGLEVVAEGVEEPAQAETLREIRPPLAQGFLFSRPLRGDDVRALLARPNLSAPRRSAHRCGDC
jgi:EAL domain-containing protein (putative c-di-GMP-specific phosphodiesterase class I)